MENKKSSWLYSDKELTKELTESAINRFSIKHKVVYFYDGNNGDKHLLVGYTTKCDSEIYQVLGVSLSQCHLKLNGNTWKNSIKNINELLERMIMPETGLDLVELFNKVDVFTF